jgi:hypothetical protein
MNEMAYVLQAWLPLIVWQQVEAPEYRKGFITVTFLSASLIVTAFTIRVLHARELRKLDVEEETAQSDGDDEQQSFTKSIPTGDVDVGSSKGTML